MGSLHGLLHAETVVNAFVPKSIAPLNPYHDFLPQQLGGALLLMAIVDAVLLRYTMDVNIWKILEAATVTYDLVLLYSIHHGLGQQGRLSSGALRWDEMGGLGRYCYYRAGCGCEDCFPVRLRVEQEAAKTRVKTSETGRGLTVRLCTGSCPCG